MGLNAWVFGNYTNLWLKLIAFYCVILVQVAQLGIVVQFIYTAKEIDAAAIRDSFNSFDDSIYENERRMTDWNLI